MTRSRRSPLRVLKPLIFNRATAGAYRSVYDRIGRTKAFVFFATTGRSGTGAFARILDSCDGVRAAHEAAPNMSGPPMIARNRGNPRPAFDRYWREKCVRIRSAARGARIFADTSHLFIKSWADFAAEDLGSRIQLVHLRRHPVRVVKSLLDIGAKPGGARARRWCLDWRYPENLVQMRDVLDRGQLATPEHRWFWYWYEIEARTYAFRAQWPQIPVHEFNWVDSLDPHAVHSLLGQLGISESLERVSSLCSVRVNRKTFMRQSHPADIDHLSACHDAFVSALKASGYDAAAFCDPRASSLEAAPQS